MSNAPFFSANLEFLADLKRSFDDNPHTLPTPWHPFFDELDPQDNPLPTPSWAPQRLRDVVNDTAQSSNAPASNTVSNTLIHKTDDGLSSLRELLRRTGYRFARTNPLQPPPPLPDDLKRVYATRNSSDPIVIRLKTLEAAYLGPLALELGHLVPEDECAFLHNLWEAPQTPLSLAHKKACLTDLLKAEAFEHTLAKLFPGAKRFSVEGAEALLPGLQYLCTRASHTRIDHIVFAMAHRGRLNILTNLFNKPLGGLFSDQDRPLPGQDDVPYHLGWEDQKTIDGHRLTCTLLPNPSHLEATDPVMLGYVRALADQSHSTPLGVLIHGEAAFSGQGVVMESLMLQGLKGYHTGGTLHVVINNQVGFTADVSETSPRAACDAAHMVGAPIIHVNGQDPEAVLRAFDRALTYRNRFQKDCVIDLVCFRRHGHNELDEPRFTNPQLYAAVDKTPSSTTVYSEQLIQEGVFQAHDITNQRQELIQTYKRALSVAPSPIDPPISLDRNVPTLSPQHLSAIEQALTNAPADMSLHPKIARFIEKRRTMFKGENGIDWSLGEALALGSLLLENIPIRLAGQDSVRGTFTQRHGAFIDQKNGQRFVPLNQLKGAHLTLINSPLSEMAALGFEIGYSWGNPSALVLWEAQFGDFVNGAQVMIDQYLSVARTKWGRTSNLTLLLPHGYEGQGAEHSSARLERFLQNAARDNIRVANATTPANFFHLLRRQAYDVPRPLIMMTPKSLLRHLDAVSTLKDFTTGAFEPILSDRPSQTRRVLLCSGKIYYDLVASKHRGDHTAILRLEQLYPFPKEELLTILTPLAQKNRALFWVQEEPQNMGAWNFVAPHLQDIAQTLGFGAPRYIGRDASDITATGSKACHVQQQNIIIAEAFAQESS